MVSGGRKTEMFTGQEQLRYSLGEKEELVPADKLLWLWVRKEQRK